MSNLFSEAKHAARYVKFRPTTPKEVIDRVISYLSEKLNRPFDFAVDVGCGSGQSTRTLSPYFRRVVGIDVSENQLEQGRNHPETPANVSYELSPAESLPFEDNSVQLITSGSAYHWFDQHRFILEAKRKLVPNGVLAVYNRERILPKGSSETVTGNIKNIIEEYNRAFSKYKDQRLNTEVQMFNHSGYNYEMKDEMYQDIISVDFQMKLEDYIGYLSTISTYQRFVEEEGKERGLALLDKVRRGIKKELNLPVETEAEIQLSTKFWLLLGRK